MLKQSTNYLSTLISAGADAMSNLYYVEIIPPESLNSEIKGLNLSVRSKDFKAPVATHGDYSVEYMTTSLNLPSSEIRLDKTFTLNFRLDSSYEVYKFLKKWQSYTSSGVLTYAANNVPGETLSSSPDEGFIVNVYALNNAVTSKDMEAPGGNEAYIQTAYSSLMYSFKYCWIKELSGLSYSYEDAGVQTISTTIGFYTYEDPQGLL